MTASDAFEDLIAANRDYRDSFAHAGVPGQAARGVAVLTCMDSRIDPLAILGLRVGDAKVLRNAGGRVTEQVLGELVLAVHLLGVDRILVIPHSRCAMGSATQDQMRERVGESAGADASWMRFGVVADQHAALVDDVATVRAHPLIPDRVAVGGFVYDVDTGGLDQLA
ncbi:MAG TPA: carbonic anhydrase [Nocardioidaceae bacterium]|nr:carbonic anhydrase [Nocardioidaceae bacterium]